MFQQIREFLNDQHFTLNDVYVTCFCEPGFAPASETNAKRNAKDFYVDKARRIGVEELDEDDPLPKSSQYNNKLNSSNEGEEEKKFENSRHQSSSQ